MAEENKSVVVEEKKDIVKAESKMENKTETNSESKVAEKVEEKKEVKKAKLEKPKKEEAIAKGTNLAASKKHCMYICSFIKNKPIDLALKQLQEVISMKRAIPFKGEIPHRHELGGRPGRYPINASKQFIYLLKALKGNVIANGLDLDKTRIYLASATWDSRPARREGTRFKRAFVLLKAKEIVTPQRERPQHKRGDSQQESNDKKALEEKK